MNMSVPDAVPYCSTPLFQEEALMLLQKLKEYAPWELRALYKTSEKLALESFLDIQDFGSDTPGTPALFAFDGLVFKYLRARDLSAASLEHANKTLRIVSALYGLLRPFDLIVRHRLELTNRLKIDERNLYDFWGRKIHETLYTNEECVINLASEEYARPVRKYLAPHQAFIDVVFLHAARGNRRTPTTFIKMARGAMTRFVLENKTQDPAGIKRFDWEGLRFSEVLSSSSRYVFTQ
jgi:cytoplasmic iron level regulating protein YaaA (DUF328/UPF0246 family)